MQKYLSLAALVFLISIRGAFAASPPGQPASGPGGSTYAHAAVSKHEYGSGPSRYWIYEPSGPAPQSAPLIIFNHGWGAINPKTYGAWIEHIVRRGNIVVYPVYQDNLRTPVADFLPNAVSAVKDALRILQEPGHVKPMLDKFAIVGHSMGGLISADMAAVAAQEGLPQPKAVMCVEPGKTWAKRAPYNLHDLSLIPAGTLLLAVSGDSDGFVKDVDAKRIYNESNQVPKENKNLVTVISDSHGTPPLKAGHSAPVAPDEKFDSGELPKTSTEEAESRGIRSRIKKRLKERVKEQLRQRVAERQEEEEEGPRLGDASGGPDALDYYAYWKLFDALCDAAFYGQNRNYALGNTTEQRFMGTWSDGVPVKELKVQ